MLATVASQYSCRVLVVQGEYAARVHNLRSYDAISRDILQRWAYPFVPDTNVFQKAGAWGASSYKFGRHHRYLEAGASIPRSVNLGVDVCIGAGTSIGKCFLLAMLNTHIGRVWICAIS